jgi:hypothetical protein
MWSWGEQELLAAGFWSDDSQFGSKVGFTSLRDILGVQVRRLQCPTAGTRKDASPYQYKIPRLQWLFRTLCSHPSSVSAFA